MLPSFARRGSSYQPAHQDLEPDFDAAFGSDNDDDDLDSDSVPLARGGSAHRPTHNPQSDPYNSHNPLDDSTHNNETDTIPGGYNFEPPTTPPALGPSPGSTSHNSATARAAQAQPNSTSLQFVTQLGNRFLGRLGVQPALFGNQHSPSSRHDLHDGNDERSGEGNALLFSHDGDGHDNTDTDASSYPPRNSHIPLPPRPPMFGAAAAPGGRVFGGGQGNDGVFANLSAKPDGTHTGADYVGGDEDGPGKDEVLPAYEVALADTTPAYWETTVLTPGGVLGPDDICVDGLPVGSLFAFAWSLLVSMSFQFIGFFLTYLLHTTHAAKNGSRAGLGITLIQLGFYLKQRIDHPELNYPGDETGLNGAVGGTTDETMTWSWWGGMPTGPLNSTLAAAASASSTAAARLPGALASSLQGALDASDPDAARASGLPSLTGYVGGPEDGLSQTANEWMAFFLVTFGSFLLIGGCLSYWRAVRWARAVRSGMGPQGDAEAAVVA